MTHLGLNENEIDKTQHETNRHKGDYKPHGTETQTESKNSDGNGEMNPRSPGMRTTWSPVPFQTIRGASSRIKSERVNGSVNPPLYSSTESAVRY